MQQHTVAKQPPLEYEQALSMFVAYYSAHQTHVCTVGMCPAYFFRKLVLSACRTARNPGAAFRELLIYQESDYERSFLDRHEAMLAILRHGCTVFWASTHVDARIH